MLLGAFILSLSLSLRETLLKKTFFSHWCSIISWNLPYLFDRQIRKHFLYSILLNVNCILLGPRSADALYKWSVRLSIHLSFHPSICPSYISCPEHTCTFFPLRPIRLILLKAGPFEMATISMISSSNISYICVNRKNTLSLVTRINLLCVNFCRFLMLKM